MTARTAVALPPALRADDNYHASATAMVGVSYSPTSSPQPDSKGLASGARPEINLPLDL